MLLQPVPRREGLREVRWGDLMEGHWAGPRVGRMEVRWAGLRVGRWGDPMVGHWAGRMEGL